KVFFSDLTVPKGVVSATNSAGFSGLQDVRTCANRSPDLPYWQPAACRPMPTFTATRYQTITEPNHVCEQYRFKNCNHAAPLIQKVLRCDSIIAGKRPFAEFCNTFPLTAEV